MFSELQERVWKMDRYVERLPLLKCGWTRFDDHDGQREQGNRAMEKDVCPIQRTKLRFKMERFFNDDDENAPEFQFQDDMFDEDEGEEDGTIAYIDKNDLLEVMQLDLAQTELSNNLLSKAVEIAEKNFFWKFRGAEHKMNQIESIYARLIQITTGGGGEEEGEENADV